MRKLSATVAILVAVIAVPYNVRAQKSSTLSAMPTTRTVASPNRSHAGLSRLPVAAQGSISAALGRDDSRFWVHAALGGLHAENLEHILAVDFAAQGVEVRSKTARWRLELRSYGYGDAVLPAGEVAPKASANRVEYKRGKLTEWYANGPLGLEQGFTLAEPPGQPHGQPLTVALALSGNVAAALASDGTALTLTPRDGQTSLRYTGLVAWDADGRELRTWLELRDERLLLHVHDTGARYPLVIDPFVQQAKLTSSDGAGGDRFGYSVAISGDTAVVGAPFATVGSNQAQGAAYVFVMPKTGWATGTETAKLTASDGASGDEFGWSVAISSDTAVVGARSATTGTNTFQGAAYVFVMPKAGWATGTETAKLTASDAAAGAQLGSSAAISGGTAVLGAPGAKVGSNSNQGAAYVFVMPKTGWATGTETAKLTASDGGANNDLGLSVAISGDTAVAGALGATVGSNSEQGAAYVFLMPKTGWATITETAKLTASDGVAFEFFGTSVAISGNTAVVGAGFATVGSNFRQGAAYVFVMPKAGWATGTETAKLTASDGAAFDDLGCSAAISGGTVLLGAPGATIGSNTSQGAAYVFVMPASGWATGTETAKLTASDGAASDELGFSVAISGGTAVFGAPQANIGSNIGQGAAYIYSNAGKKK